MMFLFYKFKELIGNSRKYFKYCLWALTCVFALTACGGGGGSDSGQTSVDDGFGQVIIGLTDAEGDFQSYAVDVVSLSLTRANGAVVETLPLTTRVDFAEYTDLTEFLTAASVPLGAYTAVSMQLDFTNAEIFVEDAMGNSVQATPVDANGDPLGLVDVTVELHGRDRFRIAPGIPAHITLDFDLESSNSVSFVPTPPKVTVEPILITDFTLDVPKRHRIRGLLDDVAVDEDVFSVFVRPFYHHGGDFGSIRVHVTGTTSYEIDGVGYVGGDGLLALSALDPRSPVVAFGELNDQREFVATEVLAGTSVPWGNKDWLTGNVTARNGDVITLSTVRRVRHDNEVDFYRSVDILLADTTEVSKEGYPLESVDIDDISVGQRIRVLGDLDKNGAMNGDVPVPQLDASNASVRMLFTRAAGSVVSPGPLAIDLQAFNAHPVAWFDFTGTGIDPGFDADPSYYEINTGSLPLDGIVMNDPVRVIGHVAPFGSAPEDFIAQSVVNFADLPAKILIQWPHNSTTPFISMSDTELVVDMNDPMLGQLHNVIQAGIVTDLTTLGMDLTLAANEDDSGLFVLAGPQRVRMFDSFANFSAALVDELDGTKGIHGLRASGQFDPSTATETLRSLVIRIKNVN